MTGKGAETVPSTKAGDVVVELDAVKPPASSVKRRGMVITFQDLEYVVVNRSNKKEKLSLLKNVTGFFEPAQMAALMGPSGSGKTTLLDVLAGRKTQGEIRGSVLFSQRAPTTMFLRRYTGYVEQFDTLLDTLTVKEMLMYTAELKRPITESYAEKEAVVSDLLHKLALDTCQNTTIGNAMNRGVSGGQAKRTNIGIALVTNPRVLFLDEPTSGLDSYTSNEVMTVVKRLCADGVTICATIHSPSQYLFDLFDKVIMLLRGQVVYFGPQAAALEHFKGFSAIESSIPTTNDAEWLTDVTVKADREGHGGDFAKAWQASQAKKDMDGVLNMHLNESSTVDEETVKELSVKRATVTPTWWAFKTLIKYRTTTNYRSPDFIGARLGDKVIATFIIFSLYWHVGKKWDNPTNVLNVAAILFMWCTLPAFGASSYVPTIVLERPLYLRERNDGLYRSITYIVAKMVDELALATVASLVFSSIVYYAAELQGEFVLFWLFYLGTLANGIVLAYLVAALSPSMEVANAALPAYVVTLMFFAGFIINLRDIPNYWKWYSYIDFVRYSWGGLMANNFGDIPAQFNNQHVLQYYDLQNVHKWAYFGYLLLFFCGFFSLAWLALTYKVHQRR